MRTKVEGRFLINWVYAIMIILVIFSNVFSDKLEILLNLKPNITYTDETQVHIIDVGQGDAIAIRFSNGKTMLVDSGTESYRDKLTNYLDNVVLNKSKEIDYVVLTHPDIDHSSNMKYIIDNYKVKNFFRPQIYEFYENKEPYCTNEVYRDMLVSLDYSDANIYFHKDMEIVDGDISIKFLTIFDTDVIISKLDTNQFSPVIIVSDNNRKIMLTGDIDTKIEEKLIEKYPEELLDIDIIKLAHHGSKYSNSEEFLNIITPDYVCVSTGENSYGHPANDTIERLLKYDTLHNTSIFNNFLNTKQVGNIIYTLFENEVKVDTIKNINNYNFVDYYIYSIILICFILWLLLMPYYIALRKDIRFYIQNKNHKKLKEKELAKR